MPLSAPGRLPRVPLILEGAGLLAPGLLAGAFVYSRWGLGPATAELPPPTQILVRQALIRHLRALMPPLMLAALGSAGLAAARSRAVGNRGLRWLGLGCAVLPLAITRFGNVPLNEQMLTWSAEAPPRDWAGVVGRWDAYNTLRAIAAVAAFACQVGVVVRMTATARPKS